MEPFDFKAVGTPVSKAGRFAALLTKCLRICWSFVHTVCVFAYSVCVGVFGMKDKRKEAANDNLGGACLTEFAPSSTVHHQHASSNIFNSFTSTDLMAQSSASEVFIPNPVHNLMAFERLPLPPGWQVVHLDLIESIYILHKWKAHGGLPHLVLISYWVGRTMRFGVCLVPAGRWCTAQSKKSGKKKKGRTDTLLNPVWVQTLPLPHCVPVFTACEPLLPSYHQGEFGNIHSCLLTGSWKYSGSTCRQVSFIIP